MTEVRLHSSELINTPGMLRYLETAYRSGDHKVAVEAMIAGYGLSRVEAVHLLSGEIAYRVEGDKVIFNSPHREDK